MSLLVVSTPHVVGDQHPNSTAKIGGKSDNFLQLKPPTSPSPSGKPTNTDVNFLPGNHVKIGDQVIHSPSQEFPNKNQPSIDWF